MVDIKKLKVAELRAELEKRGLQTAGTKVVLISRLQARLDEEEFGLEATTEPTTPSAAAVATPTAAAAAAAATVEETPTPVATATETEKAEVEKEPKKDEPPAVVEEKKENAPVEPAPKETKDDPAASKDKTGAELTAPKKVISSADADFEAKKRERANRFKIPLVETKKAETKKGGRDSNQKRNRGSGKQEKKKGGNKDSNSNKRQKKEEPLLPKEEIERRLKRAARFGSKDTEETNKLQAMLRKYRFQS